MKVLITGVAGFIGSNLAERLLKVGEHEIIGVDNLSYGVRQQVPDSVDFHELDVRSAEIHPLFDGVDVVFHLAAKNCISDCQTDPVETADINITGTVNVFEAARRKQVRKVIYAESSAIYEGSAAFPTPESEVNPESFYATSKVASMYFANAYSKFTDLRFTALRYFCVYGPRQDYRRTIPPVMSAFIIKFLKGERPIIYGSGEKRRDFIHIDDVNDFHLLCIYDLKTDNKVYNIGSGRNYSVNEIYGFISDLLNVKIEPIHKEDLAGEAEITLADTSKTQKLGWEPKIKIKVGLKSMIDYIRQEMRKGNIK